MKYAPPIVAALVIGIASWMNVHVYIKEKERFAELSSQRCTCQQTNAVVAVEAPEKPAYRRVRVLPDHIKIQVSNGGRYRWVANGWPGIFDYDSEEEAYDAWWSFHKYNLPRQNWTNVTP